MKFTMIKNVNKSDFVDKAYFRIQPKFYIECKNCGKKIGSDDFSFIYYKAENWLISEDFTEFICNNCEVEK